MTKYQVVGIGNAIVDVISRCDDGFLSKMGIEKGIMQLVEKDRGELLYDAMDDRARIPGGSVANTLAGLGNLGLSTAFIGRVRADALGRFYAEEMANGGTDFVNPPVDMRQGDLPTSRSMIFVTPDGERSMNTYLGISSELGPLDVSEDVAGQAEVLFLEGYLYDKPQGKAAFEAAARACRAGGGRAGIALSDPFCVDRHRDDFRRLVKELDYVIGNQHEWESLYQTDLSNALEQAAADAGMVVCTRSGHDVVLVRGDEEAVVPVTEIVPVDATGAGDQFAAGFLYGYATGAPLDVAGRMGCVAAAEVISHIGARPEADMKALFKRAGLIG
ncbi:Sugar or nucleoside kinase, ribokinase family [Thalassovita litoralis]|jgi:sugar/nucleoside kinase (ribokinase family)|uniref:Sugar or nucleoside kinase, ribokinase family n=1 Tax=Thalassovita litoralis TaxID=1010611 RepID=A0A521CFS2_9RHOB|nr:adenosine kinase [Thalassovita litoralis]SMO58284.1 Sugar or nucleoside kinase, ribokinase family [Thalassovita litoralis]